MFRNLMCLCLLAVVVNSVPENSASHLAGIKSTGSARKEPGMRLKRTIREENKFQTLSADALIEEDMDDPSGTWKNQHDAEEKTTEACRPCWQCGNCPAPYGQEW